MNGLYAYFGLLNLHSIDSPGHFLYQLGLMDSIRRKYDVAAFDFYSYYPTEVQEEAIDSPWYPETPLGKVFTEFFEEMIELYRLSEEIMLEKIRRKEYSFLFLKARFRNLSTLTKKWKDARSFETIIRTAVESGYSKEQIIILDTDLSLPKSFFDSDPPVTIIVPSINIPAISREFLMKCVDVNLNNFDKSQGAVFYGNIDTSNYKSGNSKSEKLREILNYFENSNSPIGSFTVISKKKDFSSLSENTTCVLRNDRPQIWNSLETNFIMLNVTKEKYNDLKFIPARIFEAMIFGMVPISYKFSFLSETFSFNNIEDLDEIVKYLDECSQEDKKAAYLHFINQYLEKYAD